MYSEIGNGLIGSPGLQLFVTVDSNVTVMSLTVFSFSYGFSQTQTRPSENVNFTVGFAPKKVHRTRALNFSTI